MRSEGGHRISREGASLSPPLGLEKVFLLSVVVFTLLSSLASFRSHKSHLLVRPTNRKWNS